MATSGDDGPEGGKKRAAWAEYLSLSTIGIEMGATLVVGLGIGWYLDRFFGTRPWLLVIFTMFGIAAGFLNLVRIAREQERTNRGAGDVKTKEGRNDAE